MIRLEQTEPGENLKSRFPLNSSFFQNLSVKKGDTRLAKKELGVEFFPKGRPKSGGMPVKQGE